MPILMPVHPRSRPNHSKDTAETVVECPDKSTNQQQSDEPDVKQGYITVISKYQSFPSVGVGHFLTISFDSGEVLEEDVKLPVGENIIRRYGPFNNEKATISVKPIVNHNKQDEDGKNSSVWKKTVQVPVNDEVVVEFKFIETDTWDSRYTTQRINKLHPNHRQRFLVFINKLEEDIVVQGHLKNNLFRVSNGMRTPLEQDTLYCNNRAKDKYCIDLGLTNGNGAWRSDAKKWKSYHNYGLAVDIYWFDKKNNLRNPDSNADKIAGAVGLTWGNSFGDPPHFEYNKMKVSELKKLYDEGKTITEDGVVYVQT